MVVVAMVVFGLGGGTVGADGASDRGCPIVDLPKEGSQAKGLNFVPSGALNPPC